ncbi:discoidin domain-containing protein, partial [Massilioclostridium coli]|uniref:discoidin domain-containing protein n=1 Tax=Massilioclostridium coli TaxID=1870991 RepID=UPI0022E3DCC9
MKMWKRALGILISGAILCSSMVGNFAFAAEEQEHVSTWDAQWIWDDDSTARNTWMDFRKTVELTEVPEKAEARLAVDSRYWLYINGELVVFEGGLKRGPTPEDGYYDVVDIAPYLKTGTNTIAVKAWYWGPKDQYASYSNYSSKKAGFLFEAQIGDQLVISDDSWKVKRDEAYLDDTKIAGVGQPNYRIPAYNIYYDARKTEDNGWEEPGYDDSGWENATEMGQAPCAPWNELYERPIPLTKDYGLKEYLNMDEYRDYTTTQTESITMNVPYNAQLTPYLKIETDKPGLEIKMTTENTNIGAVRSTYITNGNGVQEFEALGWFNGQYITYEIPAGVKIISLQYRESGYNTEFTGSFTSDNEFYNNLWQMCLRTLYITMRDSFMDCPDRERAQWWGDTTNEMMQIVYSMDENSYLLYEKGLDQMLGWMETDNENEYRNDVLQTVVPIAGDYFELPMQQLAGVCGFWEYYLYTGRTETLEKMYQASKTYLYKWDMGSNGLVVHRAGSWDWPDWGSNADVPVLENAWYYKAMSDVVKMAEVLGCTEDIPAMQERLDSIEMNYNSFWTEKGYKSTNQAKPDDRANAMAVLAGLVNESQYPTVENVLETIFNASPYMEKYVLDAMCEMGYMEQAQNRMVTRYTPMATDNGYTTLWEMWDKGGGTRNHAWSGGPMITMSKYMAGVKPVIAGYDIYEITPDMGELNQVQVSVPSVKGAIDVAMQQDLAANTFSMNVTSPAETTALVAIPRFEGINSIITANGSVVFENGVAVNGNQNVVYTGQDGKYVYFTVNPGSYQIQSTPKTDSKESYIVTIQGTEGGTVSVDNTVVELPYTTTVATGSKLTLTATPDSEHSFGYWSGSIGSENTQIEITANTDLNITANFKQKEQKEYSLIKLSNPENNDVIVEYNGQDYTLPTTLVVKTGDVVQLKAKDQKFGITHFMNWQGDIYSANSELAVKVDKDISLEINSGYAANINLAKGSEVTATDSMEAPPTWSKNNLTDGNISTGYTTNVIANVQNGNDISDHPIDITLNLKEQKNFNSISIYPRTDAVTADGKTPNFPTDFIIQTSTDGTNFTDVLHVQDDTNPMGKPQMYEFESQDAQYIRLHVLKLGPYASPEGVADPYRIQLAEIMAYSTDSSNEQILSLTGTGEGSVLVNGKQETLPFTASYPSGTTVAVEACPVETAIFTGWSGSYQDNSKVTYITMNQDITLNAGFEEYISAEKPLENIAFGKPVTSNNSLEMGGPWTVSNITDGITDATGSVEGYTSSEFQDADISANPIDVTINLGQPQQFSKLVLYPRNDVQTANGGTESPNFPVGFDIQVSNNNKDWSTVSSYSNYPNPQNQPAIFEFEPQTAQYVRILVNTLGEPTNDEKFPDGRVARRVQLTEIEVFAQADDITNFAKEATITATNSYESAAWKLSFLNDGILQSQGRNNGNVGPKGYSSEGYNTKDISATPHRITFDLGKDRVINNVSLYPRTDSDAEKEDSNITANFPEDFKILVKDSNSSEYTVIKEVTGAKIPDAPHTERGCYSVDFGKDVTAQYITIEVTKLGLPTYDEKTSVVNRVQLAEVTINGESSKQEPNSVGSIKINPLQGSSLGIGSSMPVSAIVTPSTMQNNDIIWSVEDENGMPSMVAELSQANTETPVLQAKMEGTAYLVARFTNGSPAMDKVKFEVTKPVDKSILNRVIAYAEEQQASDEFNNVIKDVQESFKAALAAAKEVSENAYAIQSEVDTAWQNLMNEIHKLGFVKGDITSLEALVS